MAPHPTPTRDPGRLPEGVDGYLDHIVDAIGGVDRAQVAGIAGALWQAWEDDRTVYIVGNGGSASTASHMACDLAKQTQVAGRRALRAIALHDNPALLTALANDADYSRVFSESLAIYGRPRDVLITISCSGRSANILGAIAAARDIGMRVIALGGAGGGEMARLADLHVNVPSHDYGVIESGHVAIEHCLTFLLHERGRASAGSRPAVLVDRDGVIVRNRDDYVKGWDEVDLIPGSVEALARLSKGGHRVFVITNQSAVGRGIMSRDELDGIHARLAAEVSSLGGRIEAFLVCPHRPDERCDCRKPNTGLLEEARDAYGVDLRRTVMIGDHETDLEAASRAGIDGILVLSGRSSEAPDGVPVRHVAADLHSATEFLLAT